MNTVSVRIDPYKSAWATLIRTKRKALGKSTSELAREVGVSTSAVSNWEHQHATPGPRAQRALIAALGIADNELVAVLKKAA